VAIPDEEWEPFVEMSVIGFAEYLKKLAGKVNLKRFSSSPRGEKKPFEKKPYDRKHPHMHSFKLLSNQ
jgi:hypothetical protein